MDGGGIDDGAYKMLVEIYGEAKVKEILDKRSIDILDPSDWDG